MVSFLRKKSFNNGGKADMKAEENVTNMPPYPSPSNEYEHDKTPLEMPDLRFSRLDLDIDMNQLASDNSRPGSMVSSQQHGNVGEQKRKSKMNFLNFSKEKETGVDEAQVPRLAMIPDISPSSSGSLGNMNDIQRTPPRQRAPASIAESSRTPPSMSGSSPNRDRKKLVASATEAMKLDVPVQAPSRSFFAHPVNPEMSKKEEKEQAKRDKLAMEALLKENYAKEKIRAAKEKEEAMLERERAKVAAKEAKEAAKREKEMIRRLVKKQQAPSARPILADAEREINVGESAATKSSDAGSVIRSSRPRPSAPANESSKPPSVIGGGRKSAPGSVINGKSPQKSTPQSSANGNVRSQSRDRKAAANTSPTKENVPTRSQSTIPAADGVARPVVQRGQTLAAEKPSVTSNRQQMGVFGTPLTDSPPLSQGKKFTAQSRQGAARALKKIAAGSSSDEGGTSTTQEAPSMDSNASYDGNTPESPDTEDERFVDAPQAFIQPPPGGPRPKRDAEREQKRISLTLDGEISKVLQSMSNSNRDSKDRFSALLSGSRPGGAADRSTNAAASMTRTDTGRSSQDSQRILPDRMPPPPPQPVKRVREAAPAPKRRNEVRPELVAQGDGWKCMGVGDIDVPNLHNRFIKETIKVPKRKSWLTGDNGETEEQEVTTRYNDLFELLWTSTTPEVTFRLISHLQMPELKALRQTSHSVRFALNVQDNREIILNQFLSPVGYRSWSTFKGSFKNVSKSAAASMAKDPCPISFNDCEAYLIGHDLLPEYAAVGKEFARNAAQMDPRMARLAQASTRAYSRVLTRLRLQPNFKVPSRKSSSAHLRADNTSSGASSNGSLNNVASMDARHNSYYPLANGSATPLALNTDLSTSPALLSPLLLSPPSPSESGLTALPVSSLSSPWKPGRAAFFRVWVPASDPTGWLSDEEMTQCETELYKAGIWQFLKRGDVVWDTAVGDKLNEGKYIYDGHYLRDLSYAHDVAGHLPSWLNSILYSPSYWHNIIFSSTPRPVIYFDISPWKDQIVSSLRLVQDHVEGYGNNGSRYRVAKWLYRCGATITPGQIVSKMNGALEIVDEGWSGKIIIETEGTAEHAKALVSRCAGPNATPQAKGALLAAVMGDASAARKMLQTSDNLGLNTAALGNTPNRVAMVPSPTIPTKEVQNSAWQIMRERSRPGLIWIKLAGERSLA